MNIVKKIQSSPRKGRIIGMATSTLAMAICLTMPFAADEIKDILNQMVGIVGLIFQAVGVMLSVYSVGQLVLAFKNEDADSKSRASTMLVVGICLIAIPTLINNLGLVDKITAPTT